MYLLNLVLFLVMIYLPAVYADHLSLKEVEDLEQQCLDAQEPIYKTLRTRYIAECEDKERNNRGDPAVCAGRFKDLKPVKKYGSPRDLVIIIDPPLPICVKAEEALDHYKLNP